VFGQRRRGRTRSPLRSSPVQPGACARLNAEGEERRPLAVASTRLLWRWYCEVLANPSCQIFIDFSVPGNRAYFLLFSIHIDGMVAAFPQEFATILFNVPN